MAALRKAVVVIGMLVAGMVSLVLSLDLVFLPVVIALMLEPSLQGWCGMFSRCASGMQPCFVEYLWSGAPWTTLNPIAIRQRVESAALLGIMIGAGFSVLVFHSTRR